MVSQSLLPMCFDAVHSPILAFRWQTAFSPQRAKRHRHIDKKRSVTEKRGYMSSFCVCAIVLLNIANGWCKCLTRSPQSLAS